MALRPIDNALPIPADIQRPKKMPKIDHPAPISEPEPEPTPAPSLECMYISSLDLKPLPHPHATIQDLLLQLYSKDWLTVCQALNDVRRLALHHSPLLLQILDKVLAVIVKTMKSPRSALIKTSIMASTDVFSNLGKALLSEEEKETLPFDSLLLQLLLKASQDKRFVCEEAEKALEAMTTSISPCPLLKKLHSFVTHSNLRVRAKAAVAIAKCIKRMEHEAMKDFGLAALLKIASQSLNDRLPEAREAARCVVSSVYDAFSTKTLSVDTKDGTPGSSTEELWEKFCASNLSAEAAQLVAKTL